MITPSEFIHPEDAAALRQMENIPGFPALVKKIGSPVKVCGLGIDLH